MKFYGVQAAHPVTLPGAEIFTSLQTGAIDATEWVGPYNDVAFGLHKAARYYYYPGWQEPAPTLEFMVNTEAWNALPADLQAIVETSCMAINMDMVADYAHGNAQGLKQLAADPNVELRRFPPEVLAHLKEITQEVVDEWVASDPKAAKVYESWSAFREMSEPYMRISEQAFLETRD